MAGGHRNTRPRSLAVACLCGVSLPVVGAVCYWNRMEFSDYSRRSALTPVPLVQGEQPGFRQAASAR